MAEREILTIGYEGSDLDDFIAVLSSLHVQVLCDVRDVTSSRKKGFSKNPLSAALAAAGIDYLHFRALGDPKEGREAARAGDFLVFRRIYGERLRSTDAKVALTELNSVAAEKRICLMCFEREPKECHRNIVAEAMRSLQGYSVRHVGVPKGFSKRGRDGRSTEKEPSDYRGQGRTAGGQDSR